MLLSPPRRRCNVELELFENGRLFKIEHPELRPGRPPATGYARANLPASLGAHHRGGQRLREPVGKKDKNWGTP